MSKKPAKSTVVAFKVEEDLANFLNQLPNKSEFIRRSIYSQLGIACPLCRGTGSVSKETHDHFTTFGKVEVHECEGCGDAFAVLGDEYDVPVNLKEQLVGVLKGGPEYCYTCFSNTPGHHHKED
ncbi:MAG: hypothetical protein U1D30_08760 [Planctomycetota bacterium]